MQKLRVRVNENELRYADTVSIFWRLVKNSNRSIRQNNALCCAGIQNKNNWAGHATIFLLRWSPRRLFWCARTWPYPYNVWTYSIIKNRWVWFTKKVVSSKWNGSTTLHPSLNYTHTLGSSHSRRMEREVKAKVVAYLWGAEFVQFLAALAVLPRSIW